MSQVQPYLCFQEHVIRELVVVQENNNIVNYDEWIKKTFNENTFRSFKETFHSFCKMIDVDDNFDHRLGTLLLNAYYSRDNFRGMAYGCLCSTMYLNNSCPNLIEINICLPKYTTLNIPS